MPDKMYVIVILRKEVPDRESGRAIYDLVKTRLEDYPDVAISGQISNHFEDEIL